MAAMINAPQIPETSAILKRYEALLDQIEHGANSAANPTQIAQQIDSYISMMFRQGVLSPLAKSLQKRIQPYLQGNVAVGSKSLVHEGLKTVSTTKQVVAPTLPAVKTAPKKALQKSPGSPKSTAPAAPSAVSAVVQKKAKDYYTIEGNRHSRSKYIPIRILIANVSNLKLTRENFLEIFKKANAFTLNKPYPITESSLAVGRKLIYRFDHNGTHSARQVRLLEALFDLIEKKGSRTAKNQLSRLSKQEKLNLFLGAYFLRAGRVDESTYKTYPEDDFYTRSAIIYGEYAKQLGEAPATIDWVKKLIFNSCKPKGVREKDIESSPENYFGYEVLTMAHQVDLVRCYDSKEMEILVNQIWFHLDYFISGSQQESANEIDLKQFAYLNQFMEYARDLCVATGVKCHGRTDLDLNLFVKSSVEGDFCWEQVQKQKIPDWGVDDADSASECKEDCLNEKTNEKK